MMAAMDQSMAEGDRNAIRLIEHVDAYVAAQRVVIEQQIGEHVATRLHAERERIAQAIVSESRGSRVMVTRHVLEIVRAGGETDA